MNITRTCSALLLLLASLFAASVTAQAQTTTNLAFRVTVETVTGGVTNSVIANVRLDSGGTKSDQIRIDGVAHAFAAYRASGGTNTLANWLKQDVQDRLREYAMAKARADNAITAAKIDSLLLNNSELLSAADLSNLATIAAKAP